MTTTNPVFAECAPISTATTTRLSVPTVYLRSYVETNNNSKCVWEHHHDVC